MPEFDLRKFMERADWAADANCRGLDSELFFPERGQSTSEAKAICHECDVRAECLAYALNNGEHHGIWGGLSERERRVIRTKRSVLATGPLQRTTVQEHGTHTGAVQHRRLGTPPCQACLAAAAIYNEYQRPSRSA